MEGGGGFRAGFSVEGYQIEALLGAGPTGELWLARQLASGELVGLKRLHPKDVDAHDEARRTHAVLGMLAHPSLLRVRELLSYGNDELVLVTDQAEGGTLDQLLFARPMLDPGEIVTIAATVAHALAAVHEHGLTHGEVTPESIVFTAEGQPLLTDVGLSGLVEHWDVLGTHGYADPAGSSTLTPESDIYGLAAVCYTSLTGTPLDPGQPRRPLHQIAPGVPSGLAHAIEAGLQADPAARPGAAAFAGQLDAACPRAAVRFPDAPNAGGSTGWAAPAPSPGPPRPVDTPSSSPGPGQPTGSGLFGPGASSTPLAPSGTAPPFSPSSPISGRSTQPGPGDASDDGAAETVGRRPKRPRRVPATVWKPLAVGVPAALLLVAVGVFGVGALGGPDPEATSTSGPSAAASGTPTQQVELSGPHAKKWAAVVDKLDARRAEAWETLDREALASVYVRGSVPWKGDVANMRRFEESGFRGAKGLRTPLVSLHTVSESADEVVLKVASVLQPYQVITSGGELISPSNEEIGRTQRVTMTLRHDPEHGWLIFGQ